MHPPYKDHSGQNPNEGKVGQCLGSVGHVGCRLASHYMLSHLIDASCHTDQSVPPVSPATPTHHTPPHKAQVTVGFTKIQSEMKLGLFLSSVYILV